MVSHVGSGCPIGPNELVTAAHVWQESGSYLKTGERLRLKQIEEGRDVAILTFYDPAFNGKFQKWFKVQDRFKDGEAIHIPIFDGGLIRGYVLWYLEREIFIDALVFPGLSGSCILNDKEEVIGVVTELRPNADNPHVRAIMIGKKVRE